MKVRILDNNHGNTANFNINEICQIDLWCNHPKYTISRPFPKDYLVLFNPLTTKGYIISGEEFRRLLRSKIIGIVKDES